MRRALPMTIAACAALALAAGCGSGKEASKPSAGAGGSAGGSANSIQSHVVINGKINYASPPANAPVQSGVVKIAYKEVSIEPDTLKAKVGSTIRWVNEDPEKCNVTSEGGPYKFASQPFGEGGTFELKLNKPGTIHYECTYYPATMNGTIVVVE